MPAYTGPRGSGFTSLKQYLELNPEQAQQMGTGLVSDVDAKGTASEKAIGGALTDFNNKVGPATLLYDPGSVKTSAEAQAKAGTVYGGPKELDSATVTALNTQAVDAQNRAKALGSDAGRATLLAEKYGANGGYTPGAAGLDAFLAGRGAGERGHTAGKKWGGLRDYLGVTEKAAQHLGADAAATTANSARRYGALADSLRGQEARAASQAQLAAERAHRAGIQARDARAADRTGNLTTVNTRGNTGSDTGTWAGSDNQVSPGGKGPNVADNNIPPGYYEDENGILRRGKP